MSDWAARPSSIDGTAADSNVYVNYVPTPFRYGPLHAGHLNRDAWIDVVDGTTDLLLGSGGIAR